MQNRVAPASLAPPSSSRPRRFCGGPIAGSTRNPRASAGLDGQQSREFDQRRIEMLAVHGMGAVQQFGEGQLEQSLHLCNAPALWRRFDKGPTRRCRVIG